MFGNVSMIIFFAMHTGSLRSTLPSGLRSLWWEQVSPSAGLKTPLFEDAVTRIRLITESLFPQRPPGRSCPCRALSETGTKRREIVFQNTVNFYDTNEMCWDLTWLQTVLLEKRPDQFCEDRCWYRQWVLVQENTALKPSYISVSQD